MKGPQMSNLVSSGRGVARREGGLREVLERRRRRVRRRARVRLDEPRVEGAEHLREHLRELGREAVADEARLELRLWERDVVKVGLSDRGAEDPRRLAHRVVARAEDVADRA